MRCAQPRMCLGERGNTGATKSMAPIEQLATDRLKFQLFFSLHVQDNAPIDQRIGLWFDAGFRGVR